MKDIKCEGKEIVCDKCNKKSFGKRCFKNHLKNRSKASMKGEDKQAKLTDIVCDTVKKCNDCSRIITGKYINNHKCGYTECNNFIYFIIYLFEILKTLTMSHTFTRKGAEVIKCCLNTTK